MVAAMDPTAMADTDDSSLIRAIDAFNFEEFGLPFPGPAPASGLAPRVSQQALPFWSASLYPDAHPAEEASWSYLPVVLHNTSSDSHHEANYYLHQHQDHLHAPVQPHFPNNPPQYAHFPDAADFGGQSATDDDGPHSYVPNAAPDLDDAGNGHHHAPLDTKATATSPAPARPAPLWVGDLATNPATPLSHPIRPKFAAAAAAVAAAAATAAATAAGANDEGLAPLPQRPFDSPRAASPQPEPACCPSSQPTRLRKRARSAMTSLDFVAPACAPSPTKRQATPRRRPARLAALAAAAAIASTTVKQDVDLSGEEDEEDIRDICDANSGLEARTAAPATSAAPDAKPQPRQATSGPTQPTVLAKPSRARPRPKTKSRSPSGDKPVAARAKAPSRQPKRPRASAAASGAAGEDPAPAADDGVLSGPPGRTSTYRGVCWYKRTQRWVVQIKIKGVRVHIGYFQDEVKAAKAYARAIKMITDDPAVDRNKLRATDSPVRSS